MPTSPAQTPDSSRLSGLAHTLGARHVAMIAFGGIIGAGLFIGSSGAINKGGPGVVLSYATCGLLVFLIMRMLGEMAVANPGQGSFAEYSALALGPWAGFVTRWLYWYFWVFVVGAETVAGAKLLHEIGLPGPIWCIGLALVALMTSSNILSVRAYGELEFWLSLLKVSALVAFIAVGGIFIVAFSPGPYHAFDNLIGRGGMMPKGLAGLVSAIPVVIFAMMGSEVATIAAAESSDPAANVARAARTVALRVMIFFVASILVITAIVPWDAIVVGLSPFKAALDVIGIPGSSAVMSVIVITAVLSCLNSGLYITSRMLFELARIGDAPRVLGKTAQNRVPIFGILIGSVAGCAAALAQLFLRGDVFTLLASTSGDIILFVYLIIAVAQIRQRKLHEAAGMQLQLKMWFYPWLSYLVVACIVAILTLLGFIPDQRLTLLLSCISVGIVFGALALRSRLSRVFPH